VGVVSPKYPSSDNARAGDQCSVRGLSGHPGCLRDGKMNFKVLEGLPTRVQCFVRVGHEADWDP